MRPPEFTGGNLDPTDPDYLLQPASMRPPEFTGGNPGGDDHDRYDRSDASMRPPEFTGGNVVGMPVISRVIGSLQ